MLQYYMDGSDITTYEDVKEKYWSVKVKPEDIKIIDGDATSEQIADDINFWFAKSEGKSVGWKR